MSWSLLKLVLLFAVAVPVLAQSTWQPGHSDLRFLPSHASQAVQMTSVTDESIQANRPQEMTIQFAIENGLHIQSHTPHSEFLIPTALDLEAPAGVKIAKITYPAGEDVHLAFSPNQMLSVYTNQFAVRAGLRAQPGHYVLHGKLKYQACDIRACSPPKTLPLTIHVTAK